MSDNCLAFRDEEAERGRQYVQVGQPRIGDLIHPRTGEGGIKVMVCPARSLIVCLSTGDKVRISSLPKNFRNEWALPKGRLEATFSMIGGERFIFHDGKQIPLSAFVRRIEMEVIQVSPIRHADHGERRRTRRIISNAVSSIPPEYQIPIPRVVATGVGAVVVALFIALGLMR